ncbi:MAG: bile acid:sodium symporter family protein [Cyclobacteriaceae bacterium]|nr:bile acid:sodium symporter family protein [Cyclobacteriaceae bacterium]UYN85745.1 MAG: bile acid:sodium symporter family protein [Cyclobacteriaceae bacterium]
MKPSTLFKIFTVLSVALLLWSAIITVTSGISYAGPFLILSLLLLGISSRGYEHFKGFTYSIMIFTGVACALYYPQYLVEVNGFKLSALITPLIQVIMFGMGTRMSVNDFVGVIKMPKGVAIGIVAQFSIMPLVGFALAAISSFPAEIAAGIILIGCSPSGLASNVMSYLAKANLALSITLTTVSTLLAPFATPILMKLLGGTYVEIDIVKMMWDIFKMIVIPICAGLLFNKLLHGKSKWLDLAMPLISMIGIGVIITIITAAGRDSLLDIGLILMVLVLIHNMAGYYIGYWFARLLKMDERDSRTIALEVGMQNAGMAAGLAREMGRIATVGLAPAVFGPLMNITGSILATYWHRKPPKEN